MSYSEINIYYNHYYSSTTFGFKKVKVFPVDFTGEYYEGITIATTFSNMVGQLPLLENLTVDWEKAIVQLRELYNGMTSYQQKFVSEEDLVTLKKYEDEMSVLIKQQEQAKEPETV